MRKIAHTMKFYGVNKLSDLREILEACERAEISDSAGISFGIREDHTSTEGFIVVNCGEA